MRFGVLLPNWVASTASACDVVEIARVAEATGFESAWLGDHVLQSPQLRALGGIGQWETYTLLGALAMATTTLRLGTCVTIQVRHPLHAFISVATAAALAPGRTVCGLGVGGFKRERTALGLDPRHAGTALDDTLRLLSGWPAARDLAPELEAWGLPPRPESRPPIWIGGPAAHATPRSQARIVEHAAGWLPAYPTVDSYREESTQLDEALLEHGRRPDEITRSALLWCCLDENRDLAVDTARRWLVPHERAMAELLAENAGLDQPEVTDEECLGVACSRHLIGDPDDVAARLEALEAVGLEHIVIGFLPVTRTRDLVQRFAQTVVAEVQA